MSEINLTKYSVTITKLFICRSVQSEIYSGRTTWSTVIPEQVIAKLEEIRGFNFSY